jgi:type I restriction-modification system DNA methylase subunit
MKPDIKNITNPLDNICRDGHDFTRVYDDWMQISLAAFCRDDDLYEAIIKPYKRDEKRADEYQRNFALALSAWMKCLNEDYRDYLGEIYEERVSLGQHGQFFTPEPICAMMVQMTHAPEAKSFSDPACGSGRTLLAATRMNHEGYFQGIDLDPRCVRMTAMNLLCRNVNAHVIQANTLELKAVGGYQIERSAFGASIRALSQEAAQAVIELPFSKHEETVQEREQYDLGL